MAKPKKKHSRHHQSKGSLRRYEAILFPLIIVALIGYFIVTRANGDDTVDENYLIASIAFFMVLMVISIPRGPSVGSRKRSHKPTKRPPSKKKAPGKKKRPPGKRPAVVEEIDEESIPKERKIISYPGAASGGKYGDAYIAISQEMILKVRSLLAVSCKNCKDVETCWEKYQDQMDYDTFLESTECHEKMDPAVISAAPPVQITEEEPEAVEAEEEVAVETEEIVTEEEAVTEVEGEVPAEDSPDFEDEGDWDDTPTSEGFGEDEEYYGDDEAYEGSEENDDMDWE